MRKFSSASPAEGVPAIGRVRGLAMSAEGNARPKSMAPGVLRC